jgi:hypothetical protein
VEGMHRKRWKAGSVHVVYPECSVEQVKVREKEE